LGLVAGKCAFTVEGHGADRTQLFELLTELGHISVLGGGADRALHGGGDGVHRRPRRSGDDEYGRHEQLGASVGELGTFPLVGVHSVDKGPMCVSESSRP